MDGWRRRIERWREMRGGDTRYLALMCTSTDRPKA